MFAYAFGSFLKKTHFRVSEVRQLLSHLDGQFIVDRTFIAEAVPAGQMPVEVERGKMLSALSNLFESADETRAAKMWIMGELQSPYGHAGMKMEFHRNQLDDAIVIAIDQAILMEGSRETSAYEKLRLEWYYSFNEELFDLGMFDYGWIQLEDLVSSIREPNFLLHPPVNRVYLGPSVLASLETKDLDTARSSAHKITELSETGAIFLAWSDWGHAISSELKRPANEFQAKLATALKRVLGG
jgi:hypothetical protein